MSRRIDVVDVTNFRSAHDAFHREKHTRYEHSAHLDTMAKQLGLSRWAINRIHSHRKTNAKWYSEHQAILSPVDMDCLDEHTLSKEHVHE